MNDARRRRLKKIVEEIGDLEGQIEEISAEEADAYDNLPDGIRDSEKGERIERNADELSNIVDTLNETADEINNVISKEN